MSQTDAWNWHVSPATQRNIAILYSKMKTALLLNRDFFLFGEAIGNAATPGLLCQLRVIVKMIVEKQMECRLAG
jgi:hypothetical protein